MLSTNAHNKVQNVRENVRAYVNKLKTYRTQPLFTPFPVSILCSCVSSLHSACHARDHQPVERASPRSTECSEERTNGVCAAPTLAPISQGGHFLIQTKLLIFAPSCGTWMDFLKFSTDLVTNTGLLFAMFQKNSSTGSFFMDDSNAKNGHFWPKIAIFALESPIKIEPVNIFD